MLGEERRQPRIGGEVSRIAHQRRVELQHPPERRRVFLEQVVQLPRGSAPRPHRPGRQWEPIPSDPARRPADARRRGSTAAERPRPATPATTPPRRRLQKRNQGERLCGSFEIGSLHSYYAARGPWLTETSGSELGLRLNRTSGKPLPKQRRELPADPRQAFPEELLPSPDPDAQVAFQPDVGARDDERVLPGADAFGEIDAGEVRIILDQRDRPRLRLPPGEAAAEALDPLARDRQVVRPGSRGSARSTVRGSAVRRRRARCDRTSCSGPMVR